MNGRRNTEPEGIQRNICPKTRIEFCGFLWPTIQACLDAGHSMRDVHEKLRLDGIEMAYSTLCWE